MSILAENKHTEAFLISEARHMRSRDRAKILAGSGSARALLAGMVVGKRTVGTAAATADAGNTAGSGTVGAITVTGAAKPGIHRLVIIAAASNAGTFVVYDPDGIPGPKGTVAAAYSAKGLAFTLSDATDFVVGDAFSIEVTRTDQKWVQLDLAAATGEAVAAGILRDDITAADGADNPDGVVFARDCEVNAAELVWPAGITAEQTALATLQLEKLGILIR